MFLFLIVGYLKKEEVKGGQDSTSIKNVFCFETIKRLPAWLTPSSGESPLRLQQNNDFCTLPSFSLWRYNMTETEWTKKTQETPMPYSKSNTTFPEVSERCWFNSIVKIKAVISVVVFSCIKKRDGGLFEGKTNITRPPSWTLPILPFILFLPSLNHSMAACVLYESMCTSLSAQSFRFSL